MLTLLISIIPKNLFPNLFLIIYDIIKLSPIERGWCPMGEILMIILSSFVLPLLADILFEIWKEKRGKDKKQE